LKARNRSDSWLIYHTTNGSGKYMQFTTAAVATSNNIYNAAPTSTVFQLGSDFAVNGPFNYVAYCFAPVVGYSSFGSYTGNGSADGPFVYTGFRPRWVMIKRTDSTSDWRIYDSSRTPANPDDNILAANTSNAEDLSAGVFDILSNGLKSRDAGANNVSAGTYIYMAFAESPFNYSRAR